MKRKTELQTKDFNLQLGFKVKEAVEQDAEVVVIEGYGNYFGTAKGDDYSDIYIDRANEVVVPSGIDIKAYKKNPVILLNHDRNKVIGKALQVTKKPDGLFIKAEIHKGACDDETFYSIKNGLIQTFSIGFRCEAGEYKEVGKTNVFFITKSSLLETSAVTIPCNHESTFQVIKSLGDEGFYAGELEETTNHDTDSDVPTHDSAVYKTLQGEEKMKIALKELLSAAEVENFKTLGLEAKLDEEQEISTKQYFDQLLAKAVAPLEARIAELEKVKASTDEQEQTEGTTDEKPAEGSEEETKSDEGSEDEAGVKEVPEETVKALVDFSEVLTKFTADSTTA